MPKPFLDLTDQVKLLIKRGLVVNDSIKAERFLQCNNYYNIVNIYGKLFYLNNNSENFIKDTNLEEIETVLFFEQEIKGALFKSVLACEMKIKSIISHYFCSIYKTSNSYLDNINYSPDLNLQKDITKFILDVQDIINKNCNFNSDNAIKHYNKMHGSVPLWVLINFLEFGKIEILFRIMKQTDQQKVANEINKTLYYEFGILTQLSPKDIKAYINSIREMRNIIAHNGKLLGFKCRTSVSYSIDLHSIFGITANSQRQDVFNISVILIPFLSYKQYCVLYNTILKRSKQIKCNLHRINIDDVLKTIGFPNDFYKYKKINPDNISYVIKPLYLTK